VPQERSAVNTRAAPSSTSSTFPPCEAATAGSRATANGRTWPRGKERQCDDARGRLMGRVFTRGLTGSAIRSSPGEAAGPRPMVGRPEPWPSSTWPSLWPAWWGLQALGGWPKCWVTGRASDWRTRCSSGWARWSFGEVRGPPDRCPAVHLPGDRATTWPRIWARHGAVAAKTHAPRYAAAPV
jgi:hypothetical protein